MSKEFADLFQSLLQTYPEGSKLKGKELILKIESFEFEIIMFDPEISSPHIEIGFFLKGHIYSRKTLRLSSEGILSEDKEGVPNSDKATPEPVFTKSNEELLQLAIEQLLHS